MPADPADLDAVAKARAASFEMIKAARATGQAAVVEAVTRALANGATWDELATPLDAKNARAASQWYRDHGGTGQRPLGRPRSNPEERD